MICPRALIMVGNPAMTWLADPSGYISIRAARKVWEQYGIEDRCGFTFASHGDHCNLPQGQYPEIQAFIKRFLLGQEDVNTDVQIAPANFPDDYDYERWIQWWGTDAEPPIYLPRVDENEISIWMEAESMISDQNGQNLRVVSDTGCSGEKYVETVLNNTSLSEDHKNWMIGQFTVEQEGDYNLFARVNPNGSYDDDSYFVAFDDATPVMANGFADVGNGWSWANVGSYCGGLTTHLAPGPHKLVIVGREDGMKIDVVKITTSRVTPDPNVLNPTLTGVHVVRQDVDDSVSETYNLQGQRVKRESIKKGVYVVKGKKHVVR